MFTKTTPEVYSFTKCTHIVYYTHTQTITNCTIMYVVELSTFLCNFLKIFFYVIFTYTTMQFYSIVDTVFRDAESKPTLLYSIFT